MGQVGVGVAMDAELVDAELAPRRSRCAAAHRERERDLEQPVALVPVDQAAELEPVRARRRAGPAVRACSRGRPRGANASSARSGPSATSSHSLGRRATGSRVSACVGLELPGVERGRAVLVQLEQVGRPAERLAPVGAPQAEQAPVAVELHGHERRCRRGSRSPSRVDLDRRSPAPPGARSRTPGSRTSAGPSGRLDHLTAGEAVEVERRAVPGPVVGQRRDGALAVAQLGRPPRSSGAARPRRSRAPRAARCPGGCRGTGCAAASARAARARRRDTRRAPRAQAIAAAASASCRARSPARLPSLVSGLARVGAAVVLEVELAADRRQLGALAPRAARRTARSSTRSTSGRPRRSATRAADSSISGVGPAAAVAVAEQDQARVAAVVIAERGDRAAQLVGLELGVVGADRRQVGEHLRAVDAAPAEAVVRRAGELVPRELLGHEALDPALAEDLRHLPVVAEGVGAPVDVQRRPKCSSNQRWPYEQLADQRLAVGEVAVRLDPGRRRRPPSARRRSPRRPARRAPGRPARARRSAGPRRRRSDSRGSGR